MSTVKDCEEREARGAANGCALETIRENATEWGLTRPMVGVPAHHLANTSDTTALTVHNTILMAMAHPEAQKSAHEEIDRVVGSDRMPTYDDLDRMPYIKAFILESSYIYYLIKYKGYRIPSGSMIFTNYWSIARDPALFDDPERFMPERYIQHPQGFAKALGNRMEQLGPDDLGYLKLWPNMAFGVGKASLLLHDIYYRVTYLT
ncbi:hypothetical protein FRC00_004394 [Tulasnella sp. 408]|nr:hypothetical protein FRC00_004394 [Tulasnella sp. 408]